MFLVGMIGSSLRRSLRLLQPTKAHKKRKCPSTFPETRPAVRGCGKTGRSGVLGFDSVLTTLPNTKLTSKCLSKARGTRKVLFSTCHFIWWKSSPTSHGDMYSRGVLSRCTLSTHRLSYCSEQCSSSCPHSKCAALGLLASSDFAASLLYFTYETYNSYDRCKSQTFFSCDKSRYSSSSLQFIHPSPSWC